MSVFPATDDALIHGPASRPSLSVILRLPAGSCHGILRGGVGSSARVTDAVHWFVTMRFLHFATKAAKPATAPSTTSVAVRGLWCEAWSRHSSPAAQGFVRLYRSSGRGVSWWRGMYWCLLLGRHSLLGRARRRVSVQMWRPRPPY